MMQVKKLEVKGTKLRGGEEEGKKLQKVKKKIQIRFL